LSHATRNLLVELLVEELPPKSLKKLGESFGTLLFEGLQKLHHLDDGAQLTTFASPRRLAVHITDVLEIAIQKPQRVKLMPVSVGMNVDGEYTQAFRKKLQQSCGYSDEVSPAVLKERISRDFDGKTEFLFHTDVAVGLPLSVNLQQALHHSIEKLPIAKVMTYQLADERTSVSFVRPAHGLIALHGAEIMPVSVLGLGAGRETKGHRFEAGVSPIILKDADSYAQQLETEGAVIASFAARRADIALQLNAASAEKGMKLVKDEALLDEVTALVERPNVLAGKFDNAFLEIPQECLILTMKANQKYFPLLDANGELSHHFLIVSNIRPEDASQVITGNERVLRSRLADAKFFFDQDRKKTLASRVAGLDEVVYHNKLGTQAERVERIWAIAQAIGLRLGGNELAAQAGEAAMLSKADLLTGMVGEFPELQGIMGRYYASHDGLSDDIAFAIEDHYKPRFAGDELPRNMVGICVALADKLETLAGMFGIGQIPTGDKDPFALRRHALGVVRMLIQKHLDIDLMTLVNLTLNHMPTNRKCDWAAVVYFLLDRARSYFTDQGYDYNAIESVISPFGARSPLGVLADIIPKAAAFLTTEEGRTLAEANKRITNILKKSGHEVPFGISPHTLETKPDESLFKNDEEIELWNCLQEIGERSFALKSEKRFAEALEILVLLAPPVKSFFEQVLVNAEDPRIRDNRITLLQFARAYMNQVADLSLMAT
jgi:glycyl-tRNA synthetase beta chain